MLKTGGGTVVGTRSTGSEIKANITDTVDRCYRKEAFNSDRERVEFLFKLYEQLTAPLLPVAGKVKRKRKAEKEGVV